MTALPDDVDLVVARQLSRGVEDDMHSEITRALTKHGYEKTPMNPLMPNSVRLAILVEEVGEVARAMTYDEGDPDKLDEELVQVLAMAHTWLIGLRQSRQ